MSMVEPQPYIMNEPLLELDGEVLHCLASHLELAPDVNVVETPTFCGVKEFPGTVKWYFRLTLYQSFDDKGTDEILAAARLKGIVEYRVLPDRNKPISERNPEYSGRVIVKPYTLIAGDAGAASTVDIEWTMTAEPDKKIQPDDGNGDGDGDGDAEEAS